MKFTNVQLKQIIKEEIEKTLSEEAEQVPLRKQGSYLFKVYEDGTEDYYGAVFGSGYENEKDGVVGMVPRDERKLATAMPDAGKRPTYYGGGGGESEGSTQRAAAASREQAEWDRVYGTERGYRGGYRGRDFPTYGPGPKRR